MPETVAALLDSSEPAVRLNTLARILGNSRRSSQVKQAQEAVRRSDRVRRLLSERDREGKIPLHPYTKWRGSHWVLSSLAEIGYPAGDESLIPMREQVLEWLLSRRHLDGVREIQGRARRCASQEGNALFSLHILGLADQRADELAGWLRQWQWPDGGWNCDKTPSASKSSFMETLLPLRALVLHASRTGCKASRQSAELAADVFLKRKMFRRQSDGRIIQNEFITLHYPCYWHYDILFGLKVMAEGGWIKDPRCADALDLLESKRLNDGGFPAEKKYYHISEDGRSGQSLVAWGKTSTKQMNEFVTADALYVLKAGGR